MDKIVQTPESVWKAVQATFHTTHGKGAVATARRMALASSPWATSMDSLDRDVSKSDVDGLDLQEPVGTPAPPLRLRRWLTWQFAADLTVPRRWNGSSRASAPSDIRLLYQLNRPRTRTLGLFSTTSLDDQSNTGSLPG